MKKNSISIIDEGYFLLNENQTFRFDKEVAKKFLENIQFPIIVLDTEFFNHSHDSGEYEKTLFTETQKDLVYVIQYSFAKSLKEISYRDNHKAIKSITIKRGHNEPNYDFHDQYSKMITSFLNMCRNKDIRTIVCAGASNDVKIINQWINDNKKIFARKPLSMAFYNKDKKELNANYFDIYEILENAFSFSNTNSEGNEFYNPNNLPPGKQSSEMIALTSSKKFFDWFEVIDDNILKDEDDEIRNMCKIAYSFYACPKDKKISFDQYKSMNKTIKKVVDHCYNDVLKVLIFLDFVFQFTALPYAKNSYIKK
ncbi:hypothetical protein SHELI_v1c05890 [Spiroplasma helicoides]|uniref:Uncharacterized protein n=1 Tax=Spiroplasma helicoides TaxID=216938 RepID=A0A1B3SKU7_9MOLU|nr:hypothetical protein [Spiroplasma helicoides]AOG60540.1 hypothetical protein SHELI_v1c05890 [Spiroplasma helicoides]